MRRALVFTSGLAALLLAADPPPGPKAAPAPGEVKLAAVTYDPNKARGLDAALKTLAGHAYGVWLLVLIALGFAAFGVFCFAQAKYRKV